MNYFVTGGTGFIGKNVIDELLARKGDIYLLVRNGSRRKLNKLIKDRWTGHTDRIHAVGGDLGKSFMGIAPAKRKFLKGKIDHFFHIAALYDLDASTAEQEVANIDGTRNAVRLAAAIAVKRFHHVSSIAAAGMYQGIFREDMFEEAQGLAELLAREDLDAALAIRTEATAGSALMASLERLIQRVDSEAPVAAGKGGGEAGRLPASAGRKGRATCPEV